MFIDLICGRCFLYLGPVNLLNVLVMLVVMFAFLYGNVSLQLNEVNIHSQ